MSTKRPPVEPLSRPAWDRVEAGVFARLDRGEHLIPSIDRSPAFMHTRRWALAGALAAAASVALWWQLGSGDELAAVAGQTEQVAPHPAAVARHEARIVTSDAPTETTLGESVLTLAAHSDVSVAGSDAEGWLVRLDAGRVDCEVAPRHGRPPFVVQGGETRVTVVGTRFRVARRGDESRVGVTQGHVQVDSGSTHVLLGPGENWPSSDIGNDIGNDIGSDPSSDPKADLDPDPSTVPNDDPSGDPSRDPGTDPSDDQAGESHDPAIGPRSVPGLAPALEPNRIEPVEEPMGRRAEPRRTRNRSAYVVATRAQQRFERAARLEAKDPAAALALYQQLGRGKGPWAANALYAQARLELERGRPQLAEPLLRRYLERYPKGLNSADVRKLLTHMEE